MTTRQFAAADSTDDGTGAAPIACSLTTADLAAQSGRWQRLAARALIERAETSHGLRICFRPEAGVEAELRDLVAVENQCCRWADWAVETSAGQVAVDVRSSGEGITALHGMFTGLRNPPAVDGG
ncbi:MAG: hypothetical protein ACLQFR_07115 [Streptosporangiaceae bacterium]